MSAYDDPLTEIHRESSSGTLAALHRNGSGTPLVLLHGAMADARAWSDVAAAIRAPRPLLLPNRRGRSPGPPIEPGYGIEQEVEDLLDWLASLDGPVDLAAHSFGGLVAAEATLRGAPVRSLVLYEPVVWPFGREALPALEQALDRRDLDVAVEIVNIRISGYSEDHVASLRQSHAWARLRELAVPLAAELQALAAHGDRTPSYAALPVPTTLVAGQHSRHRAPYGTALDRYLDALGGDVVVLPDQDHIAHVTAPTLLARAIEDATSREHLGRMRSTTLESKVD